MACHYSHSEFQDGDKSDCVQHQGTLSTGVPTLFDITSLQDKIYLRLRHSISIYEDFHPFDHVKDVTVDTDRPDTDISMHYFIKGCETNSCLYTTSDSGVYKLSAMDCIVKRPVWLDWNMRRKEPCPLYVCSDGRLLILRTDIKCLEIYGANAQLLRSVNLPTEVDSWTPETYYCAIESDNKEFIVSCRGSEEFVEGRAQPILGNILKLSVDGSRCEWRSKPDYKLDQVGTVWSLACYSSDRVIATDQDGNRVILLDAELNTQCTLVNCISPLFMCYKKDTGQLIVASTSSFKIDVYTLDEKPFKCIIGLHV